MRHTRRNYLTAVGSIVATAGLPAVSVASEAEWRRVETPVDETLHGVVDTAEGPYAVGGGGVIIRRCAEGWCLEAGGGPTGNGNNLYGAAVTDDGRRVWFVGASGAIGEYDVVTGSLRDHSAPNDVTNNFNDVAVEGPAGEANVYVAGDSGKMYSSFENGATGTWNEVTPGSGSEVNAVDFHDRRSGHAIDGNQTAFTTADGGTYEKVGIADANHQFYGVTSEAVDEVTVVGDGGTVYDYDGSKWVRTDLGDARLNAVEGRDLTVGDGGVVFRRATEWRRESTPTGANLTDAIGGTRNIAVGASGVALEK